MESSTRELVLFRAHQFLYKPILATEFRVVHLLPGNFNDEIECVLETRSFRVKTRYEALSYQWGDESNKKPIRIARLDSSSQPKLRILYKALPKSVTRSLVKTSRALQTASKRYVVPFWILGWVLVTVPVWRFLLPLPVEKPDWVPAFFPRDAYIGLLCMMFGAGAVDALIKAYWLVLEIAETKPWLLAYDFRTSKQHTRKPLDFETTLQVTTNLALALRYLRREKHTRTLWVDALCINQDNEDEKSIQIQRMDWIYANASPIVVWLGGYHGLKEEDKCTQGGVMCEHQNQIRAAFDHIWFLSGWRLIFGFYFSRDEKKRFQESRSGLCEIAKRGWWERLWVLQEVALATGPVQIQCGHYTCDFGEFGSAQYALILKYPEDKILQDDFRPIEYFRSTIKDFQYSSFHDKEGELTKMISNLLMKTMGFFFRDVAEEGEVGRFHELPFAQRLHRILIKTAGRFKCRDDRDRLHAVLGIAGGVSTGKATKMANFVEYLSSHKTSMVIMKQFDDLWEISDFRFKVYTIAFSVLYALWGVFYDSKAKHWAINRPDYVVAGYRKVISAVGSGPRGRPSRVEFFTSVAGYLARETGSVSFLDLATCGEDDDKEMPSWVSTWSREISKPAYDFAIRVKKDQAQDMFEITEEGKTLHLVGQTKGRINILLPAKLDYMKLSPWHGAFEKVLMLPSSYKCVIVSALQLIGTVMEEKESTVHSEVEKAEKELLSAAFGLIKNLLDEGLRLLKDGGPIIVQTHNGMARELGFLRAGKVMKGDRLLFVPGCFHHLVLRQTSSKNLRWKLVALVETVTTKKIGCSKTEWDKLLKDKAVHRYVIE